MWLIHEDSAYVRRIKNWLAERRMTEMSGICVGHFYRFTPTNVMFFSHIRHFFRLFYEVLILYDDSALARQVLMRNPITVHRAAIDIDSSDDVIRRLASLGFYGNS